MFTYWKQLRPLITGPSWKITEEVRTSAMYKNLIRQKRLWTQWICRSKAEFQVKTPKMWICSRKLVDLQKIAWLPRNIFIFNYRNSFWLTVTATGSHQKKKKIKKNPNNQLSITGLHRKWKVDEGQDQPLNSEEAKTDCWRKWVRPPQGDC